MEAVARSSDRGGGGEVGRGVQEARQGWAAAKGRGEEEAAEAWEGALRSLECMLPGGVGGGGRLGFSEGLGGGGGEAREVGDGRAERRRRRRRRRKATRLSTLALC